MTEAVEQDRATKELVDRLLRQREHKNEYNRRYQKKVREKARVERSNLERNLKQLEEQIADRERNVIIVDSKDAEVEYHLQSQQDYDQLLDDLLGTLQDRRVIKSYSIKKNNDEDDD